MKTNHIHSLPAPSVVKFPTKNFSPEQIRNLVGQDARGKREFTVYPTCYNYPCMSIEKTYPYIGRYKTYPKYINNVFIPSFAIISENLLTIHSTGSPEKSLRSPKGMIFQSDDLGIKLVRLSDGMEYHPSRGEFFEKNFAEIIRTEMAANFKRRAFAAKAEKVAAKNKREADRIERIFKRDLKTTRVTLDDSRKAGNCVEGTLRFCEAKLKLNREAIIAGQHLLSVSAERILAVANGSTNLAMNACKRAWLRETTVMI